jgi:hypothetical protein
MDQQTNTKPCHLWLLSQDLFLLLSDCLLDRGMKTVFQFNDDWRNLTNTSKGHIAEVKRRTRQVDLSTNSNQFLINPPFRRKTLSLVHDPSSQISCCFRLIGNLENITMPLSSVI